MGVRAKLLTRRQLQNEVYRMREYQASLAVQNVQNVVKHEVLNGQLSVVKNLSISMMELQRRIAKRKEEWIGPGGVSKVISGAYIDAYNGWKTAIANQEAWDSFMSQLLFSVLEVGALGALGLVFSRGKFPVGRGGFFEFGDRGWGWYAHWNTKGIREIVSPGLEEVIKDMSDKAIGTLIPAYPKNNDLPDAIPIPEPLEFQNVLEKQLNLRFNSAESELDRAIALIKNTPVSSFKPGYDKIFDGLANLYLGVLDLRLLAAPKNLNRLGIARELEIGLWAGWILRENQNITRFNNQFSWANAEKATSSMIVGSKIQGRWRQLGIFDLASVRDIKIFGSADELRAFVPWAKSYKPRARWGEDFPIYENIDSL